MSHLCFTRECTLFNFYAILFLKAAQNKDVSVSSLSRLPVLVTHPLLRTLCTLSRLCFPDLPCL